MTAWSAGVMAGNRRMLARLLTHVENQSDGVDRILDELYPHAGNGWVVGVTGAPGTGKSTLIAALIQVLRGEGLTVAVLAVDPTSPFTGGALLGDRVRMGGSVGDTGVFIRSMATRGQLGGLARAAYDAVTVLDAAGFDMILVETVGAGQSEVDIVRLANTTLVVEAPGMGDGVQAIKAGILEIADILIVNKADRPDVANTMRALQAMLDLGYRGHHRDEVHPEKQAQSGWVPPIIKTTATTSEGVLDVVKAIDAHRQYLRAGDLMVRQQYTVVKQQLEQYLRDHLYQMFVDSQSVETFEATIHNVVNRQMSPRQAVEQLVATDNHSSSS